MSAYQWVASTVAFQLPGAVLVCVLLWLTGCASPVFVFGQARAIQCDGGITETVLEDGSYETSYGGPCRVLEGGEISPQGAGLVTGAANAARTAAAAVVGVP